MTRRRRSMMALALITTCIAPIYSALASETISYSYDESGRLVKVSRSGTVNNGVQACYTYDKADNRTNVNVELSATCTSGGGGGGGGTPSFSVNNVTATEGGLLQFVVTRSVNTSGTNDVTVSTAHGTAGATDYSALSATVLTFAAGETTKSVNIATIDNLIFESNEVMYLNLTNPTNGATISDNQGTGTILDNDEEEGGGCPPQGCP